MTDWPRVTSILKDFGLLGVDFPWFEPKHRRRGRYVDHWCNEIGRRSDGPDEEWYARKSGDPAQGDEIEHEICRPFIDAYRQALAETNATMTHCALEVRNTACRYVGHIDQVWDLFGSALIDIKTGGESDWHKYQLGLYQPAVVETLKIFPRRYNLYLTYENGKGKYRLFERKDRRDIAEAIILAQAWHIVHGRNA